MVVKSAISQPCVEMETVCRENAHGIYSESSIRLLANREKNCGSVDNLSENERIAFEVERPNIQKKKNV